MTEPHQDILRTIWRLAADEPVSWRCWDGEYVVYNPLSGQTHVLDIVSGEVVKSLLSSPLDLGSLSKKVACFLDVENDMEVTETVGRILAQLEEVALVRSEK